MLWNWEITIKMNNKSNLLEKKWYLQFFCFMQIVKYSGL